LPFARLTTTLLFALHPIQTEAVTYVTGRSMSLMALFGLAALLVWLEARGWRRWLALPLFAAALMVKEVALVFPLLLALLDPATRTRPVRLLALVLGLAALLGALGYAYVLTEAPPRNLLANLASETNAAFWLAGQLVQPWALNIDPDLPEYPDFLGLPGLQLIALLALAVLAWRGRERFPPLAFGLAWAALALAPMYTLIPRLDLANERHLYLAGLGLYWIIGVVLTTLPLDAWRRGGVIAALTLAGLLLTAARNQDYQDEVSLWRATVVRSPHKDRAWNNLGYACALAGRRDEARAAFQTTLRLNPRHPRAGPNLRALEEGRLGPS
jgi:tetratricopeptide (TPR) repeat protein